MVCDKSSVAFGIQNDGFVVKRRARRWGAACGFVALAAFAPASADAAWLSADGPLATLRGSIEMSDAASFVAFMRAHPDVRVLRLDSLGGSVPGAIDLGKAVRRARLTTMVDASRDICDSACTMIFAAGLRRHYVNAETIPEGFTGQSGLGYHRSYDRGTRVEPSKLSARGERLMLDYYRSMGAPAASMLALRGTISTLWRPNGATALRLGLATSLAPPELTTSSRRISGSPARASGGARTSPAN